MKYCSVLCFTWCILVLSATVGRANDKIVIDFPTNITAGQEYSGSCTLKGVDNDFGLLLPEENCIAHKTNITDQRINFTLICEDVSDTLFIECDALTAGDILPFNVIPKPKITNNSTNVTTMVGLPVTLSCHVEGDPDHYWVGWIHRQSNIQEGEQYAMSTARTTRGTRHYLTIHTVKKIGKYVCKVFTIKGPADQKSHHVTVENDMTEPEAAPLSLMSVIKKLLFS